MANKNGTNSGGVFGAIAKAIALLLCLGLIGGVIGCIISFIASVIINLVSIGLSPENIPAAILGGEGINRVSVIPPWLLIFAIVFSVLIGLGSGYYPANKAVQIPALEAIKSE